MIPHSSPPSQRRIRALLKWFDDEARDLPWRRTRDPYGIWISEVMLQQTQVRTVIPYWERWMHQFPDPTTLASASEEKVLKLWEGLGYYSRARNLQKAARQIVEIHAGVFPQDPHAILDLPGIGSYTAGAIGSIAFNRPDPILDGNVIRVLTRWMTWGGDPKSAELQRKLWAEASSLVASAAVLAPQRRNCSRFNQALMELGAITCTPVNPRCGACPVRSDCRAFATGATARYPETARRPTTTPRKFIVLAASVSGKWGVVQRLAGEINAGLWEFPSIEVPPSTKDLTARLVRWTGLDPADSPAAGQVRHAITRYRITQEIFTTSLTPPALPQLFWVSHAGLMDLPMSGAHRKIANRVAVVGPVEKCAPRRRPSRQP